MTLRHCTGRLWMWSNDCSFSPWMKLHTMGIGSTAVPWMPSFWRDYILPDAKYNKISTVIFIFSLLQYYLCSRNQRRMVAIIKRRKIWGKSIKKSVSLASICRFWNEICLVPLVYSGLLGGYCGGDNWRKIGCNWTRKLASGSTGSGAVLDEPLTSWSSKRAFELFTAVTKLCSWLTWQGIMFWS